ncbi:MAG: type II secretion system protein GspG [Polyangiaceae bacterium]|nr:type II secretion system protein GspG [Polyangiaceae bacterium]
MRKYSTASTNALLELGQLRAKLRSRSERQERPRRLLGKLGIPTLATRGVTLVEVMIVVAIMAMVAGGVALVVIPKFKKAQVDTAESGARVIRQAVQQWQMSNADCPTVSQLVQQKLLDKGANTVDPWGNRFQINCDNDEITVSTAGPDKKTGTADDVTVPKPSAPEEGAEGK